MLLVRYRTANLLSFAFWLQLISPFCWVLGDDGSGVGSSVVLYSWVPCLSWTGSVEGLSPPLYGLMASLYRRGRGFYRALCAFTGHLPGKDLHLHGRSVVKVRFGIAPYLSLLLIPQNPYRIWFLANESHPYLQSIIDHIDLSKKCYVF